MGVILYNIIPSFASNIQEGRLVEDFVHGPGTSVGYGHHLGGSTNPQLRDRRQ